ncbi:hypothetical protein HanHA300_Chr11g0423271 [Helianthus annuus]|nr:hypothetical protein HanHA300_Chr11g0423271 [Helianthus annuus]
MRSTRAGHWWFITLDLRVRLGTRLHGNGERRNACQWLKHQTLLVC